jgi:CopG family transcriptional regulator/antitoxin EndoAI
MEWGALQRSKMEVRILSASNIHVEVVVRLPKHLKKELDGFIQQEDLELNDFFCHAAKMYIRDKRIKHLREMMKRGYVEMAKINLTISSESFEAEIEAETSLVRIVNGG